MTKRELIADIKASLELREGLHHFKPNASLLEKIAASKWSLAELRKAAVHEKSLDLAASW